MADGSIKGRLSGIVDKISNVSAGLGSVESVKVRFNGSVYTVWPPAKGFEVEITAARTQPSQTPNFDVTITDSRVQTPPDPASFDVTITGSRVQIPPDPASFDVTITDSRIQTPPDPASFDVTITDSRVSSQ